MRCRSLSANQYSAGIVPDTRVGNVRTMTLSVSVNGFETFLFDISNRPTIGDTSMRGICFKHPPPILKENVDARKKRSQRTKNLAVDWKHVEGEVFGR